MPQRGVYPVRDREVINMSKLRGVDWDSMRAAYINGASLTDLAKVYGVNRSTIANHCRYGGWSEAREEAGVRTGTVRRRRAGVNGGTLALLFNSGAADGVDQIQIVHDQCIRIVRTGLDRIEAGMGKVSPSDAGTIRSYCQSLKDLQTVAGAFAGMTRQEIAARIEQIQRQRQIDDEYGSGVVMIPAVQEPVEVPDDG